MIRDQQFQRVPDLDLHCRKTVKHGKAHANRMLSRSLSTNGPDRDLLIHTPLPEFRISANIQAKF